MGQSRGTVAWFNNAKGFGFINHSSGPDLFVHYTAITGDGYKTLKESDSVEFDIETGSSGKLQAANVRKLEEEK